MTSEKAVCANRVNALVSTGPRTPKGKARSGQNALKHGLSVRRSNPEIDGEIRRLAAAFAREDADDAIVQDAARSLAEAQLHLQHVQAIKKKAIILLQMVASVNHEQQSCDDQLKGSQALDHIKKLERYERRALSRRKAETQRMERALKLSPQISSTGRCLHAD